MIVKSSFTGKQGYRLQPRSSSSLIGGVAFCHWFISPIKVAIIFLFFQNTPAAGTLLTASITLGFALTILLLAGVSRRWKRMWWPTSLKLVAVYLVWSGVSLLWTHADSTAVAFFYWAAMVLDVFVVWMLFCIGDVEWVVENSIRGFVFGATILAFISIFVSGTTVGGRLGNADYLHPNALGGLMALAAISSIYFIARRRAGTGKRIFWYFVFMVLLFTLLMSLSKTSIAAFLVAILGYIFMSKYATKMKWRMAIMILAISAISSQIVVDYLVEYFYGGLEKGYLETLSGRTLIWEETWELIKENWILGYGFMSFRDYGPQIVESLRLVHAHNEWLHLWFSLGVVGVFFAASIYVTYFLNLREETKNPLSTDRAIMGMILLLFSLVRGLFDASVAALVFPIPLMLLMILRPNRKAHANHYGH